MLNSDDEKFVVFKKQLELNFPFFRMFLADNVDAIITHFLSTGKINIIDLARVYDGIYDALLRLIEKYPTKTAKSVDDKIKLFKGKDIDACDIFNHHVVFRLSQVIIHLLSEITHILSYNPDDT